MNRRLPILRDASTPAEKLAAAVLTVLDHHGCLEAGLLAMSGSLQKDVTTDLVDIVTQTMKELDLGRVTRT